MPRTSSALPLLLLLLLQASQTNSADPAGGPSTAKKKTVPDQDYESFEKHALPRLRKAGLNAKAVFATLDTDISGTLSKTEYNGLRAIMSDAAKRNSDTARRDRFGRKPEPPGRPAGGPKVPETNFEDFMRHAGKRAEHYGMDPQEVFDRLDKDGSQGLNREELASVRDIFATAGKGMPHPDRGVSFEEFERRFIGRLRTGDEPHGHHKAFMKLDKNGDNKLQRAELAEIRHIFAEQEL